MNIRPVSQWTLYRMRFAITYTVIAVMTVLLLVLHVDTLPPGLGPSEQQSIVTSGGINFTQLPIEVIDLPFHAVQKLSIQWLGVSPLGVRLPAMFFGAATALCAGLLLRRWFKPNVAAAATFIFLTSSWFLSTERLGTPSIMIPFWTSLLMLTATYVSQQTKAWKWWRVAFAMAAALSLYTPFMAYLFAAAALATIAQPHLRYLLRESNKTNLFIGGFFFVLLLVPLGWGIYHRLDLLRELLAIPASIPGPIEYGKDLLRAINTIVNPFNTKVGEVVTPLLSLVSTSLILIGGARLLRDFHSVRAHLLLIWAALLVPIVGFNPNNLFVLLIPAMLVLTIGLNQIVRYWYRLFPRNPYARLFGLIPLLFLLFSIVQLSYHRYMLGMAYSPAAGVTFKPDAFLAQSELTKQKAGQPVTLVVAQADEPLYRLIADRRPNTYVAAPATAADRPGTWIIAGEKTTIPGVTFTQAPTDALVSDRKEDGLRFWVYQR